MKKWFLYIGLALFIGAFVSSVGMAQQPMEDVVYLKNGSIIRGMIIEQAPGVSLKIKTQTGNVFVYKMEEVEKMTKEPIVGKKPPWVKKEPGYSYSGGEKLPLLAFGLSFLIPGVGQYYNGDIAKGVIQEILVIGGYTTAILFGHKEEWHGGYYYDYYTIEPTPFLWVGWGAAWFGHLWSMIDAPLSSIKINKQRSYGHLFEFGDDEHILGLDLIPNRQGVDTKLTLHF